jgi:hypothetical protein
MMPYEFEFSKEEITKDNFTFHKNNLKPTFSVDDLKIKDENMINFFIFLLNMCMEIDFNNRPNINEIIVFFKEYEKNPEKFIKKYKIDYQLNEYILNSNSNNEIKNNYQIEKSDTIINQILNNIELNDFDC